VELGVEIPDVEDGPLGVGHLDGVFDVYACDPDEDLGDRLVRNLFLILVEVRQTLLHVLEFERVLFLAKDDVFLHVFDLHFINV